MTEKKDFGFMAVVETFKALVEAGVTPEQFRRIRSSPVVAHRVVFAMSEAMEELDISLFNFEGGYTDYLCSIATQIVEQRGECYVVVDWRLPPPKTAEVLLKEPVFGQDGSTSNQEAVCFVTGEMYGDRQDFERCLALELACHDVALCKEERRPSQIAEVDVFKLIGEG